MRDLWCQWGWGRGNSPIATPTVPPREWGGPTGRIGGRRRVAVELHLQGYGHVEIAGMLGQSDEAVRKLVSRGLEDLKVLLSGRGMG